MRELNFCRFCDGLNSELTKLSEKVVWGRKKRKCQFYSLGISDCACYVLTFECACQFACMCMFDCLLAFVFTFFILTQWNRECIGILSMATGIFLCKHTTSDSQSGQLSDCSDSLRCTKLNEKDSDKHMPILVGMALYIFVKIFIYIHEQLCYTRIKILGSCLFLQYAPANLHAKRLHIYQQ